MLVRVIQITARQARAEEKRVKGQMNQNFYTSSLASLKQLNTNTDHYKVYSPKNFAS